MTKFVGLSKAHFRIARPTDDLAAVVRFYQDGLGFEVLSEFAGHNGFEGVMLGHRGAGYHLEFARAAGHTAGRAHRWPGTPLAGHTAGRAHPWPGTPLAGHTAGRDNLLV